MCYLFQVNDVTFQLTVVMSEYFALKRPTIFLPFFVQNMQITSLFWPNRNISFSTFPLFVTFQRQMRSFHILIMFLTYFHCFYKQERTWKRKGRFWQFVLLKNVYTFSDIKSPLYLLYLQIFTSSESKTNIDWAV